MTGDLDTVSSTMPRHAQQRAVDRHQNCVRCTNLDSVFQQQRMAARIIAALAEPGDDAKTGEASIDVPAAVGGLITALAVIAARSGDYTTQAEIDDLSDGIAEALKVAILDFRQRIDG